jgi:hypothetical protein
VVLPHAPTLARARSSLAALADRAASIEESSAFEHVLIALDRLYADDCPAIDPDEYSADRAALLADATEAIEELARHGVDPLGVELVLAMLEDASASGGP